MKYLFFVISFLLATDSIFSKTSSSSRTNDTIYATISAANAHDTIIAYSDNPWFVILDVKTPTEYATQHLSEGVDIDFYSATFAATLATLNKSKVYLLHCAGGSRSAQVYIMMQNLNFRRVYEMTGGINAWTGAGFPVTTLVAPVAGVLCDTIVSYNNIPVSQTDSVELTLTNAANSILSFSTISGISGTDFTTNFNPSNTIPGARDYSFKVYYNPTDLIADSTIFSIISNGGIINFYLSGTPYNTTGINNTIQNNFSVYNDNINQIISIQLNNVNSASIISIFDLTGKVVYEKKQDNSIFSIDYSTWNRNIYFIRITDNTNSKTYKLPLIQ